MTVIACRNRVMAADTAAWDGDITPALSAKKIARLTDGSLFGASGWAPVILRAKKWLEEGARDESRPAPADETDLTGIVLRPDGSLWTVSYKFDLFPKIGTIACAGSHNDFLLGAMLFGATAEEAVALAIKHCAYARGEVQVERMDNATATSAAA